MHAALRVITQTFVSFAIASLEQGASGIFYATNGWASESMMTADQYREFGEHMTVSSWTPSKAGASSTFCIIAAHTSTLTSLQHIQCMLCLKLGHHFAGQSRLQEGKLRSGKAVMGGISEKTILKTGEPEQVREEVARAIEITCGTHFRRPRTPIPPDMLQKICRL